MCADCSVEVLAGTQAGWDATTRTVHCTGCLATPAAAAPPAAAPPATLVLSERPVTVPAVVPVVAGVGGGSAQAEYERRVAARQARVRARYPRLGGLMLAVSEEPVSTRVWAQGARGERAVATRLDDLSPQYVEVLNDRRMRRPDGRLSRGNIDHIVVAAAGVWVVDAKTHRGALEVRRTGGILRPRTESLYIGGRNKTSLLDGLAGQVDAVRAALDAAGADVAVRGALCFVGTELPWFGESIGDVPLVGRKGLGRLLKRPGDLEGDARAAVATFLAERFPPAAE